MAFKTQKKKLLLLLVGIVYSGTFLLHAKEISLSSPDNKIITVISIDQKVYFSISYHNNELLKPSLIALDIEGITKDSYKIKKLLTREVKEEIHPVVPSKNAVIPDHYNELSITMNNNYTLIQYISRKKKAFFHTMNVNMNS